MDVVTLAAAIGVAKSLPDTAAGKAEAAALRAEEAATVAQEYGNRIAVDGSKLIIVSEVENG